LGTPGQRALLADHEAQMKPLEIVQNFDRLPDDTVVSRRVTAIVTGLSERTLRRTGVLPAVPLSPNRVGHRVGGIRALVRNGYDATVK
jgi:hypothetical protein